MAWTVPLESVTEPSLPANVTPMAASGLPATIGHAERHEPVQVDGPPFMSLEYQ